MFVFEEMNTMSAQLQIDSASIFGGVGGAVSSIIAGNGSLSTALLELMELSGFLSSEPEL